MPRGRAWGSNSLRRSSDQGLAGQVVRGDCPHALVIFDLRDRLSLSREAFGWERQDCELVVASGLSAHLLLGARRNTDTWRSDWGTLCLMKAAFTREMEDLATASNAALAQQ